jgi:tetratricopeptide (TPR) repeat protein
VVILRIRQDAERASGHYRLQVELDEDGLIQAADVNMTFELSQNDARELRWYLEDYLEYPLDPAPRIADRIEGRMADLGRDLFEAVFPAGSETRDLWSVVRDRLSETRVEVITDVANATAVPWELLRDPKTDRPVALRARSFVRGYRRGAQRPQLPQVTDGEIRILLVICRPGGRKDVPFRSVASQLIRLYPTAPHAFRLKVLRPATFEALGRELRRAADRGEPYHVVHFDGHGTWTDLTVGEGGGGGTPSPLRYAVRGGAHGYLLFEDPDAEDNVEYVDGARLGSMLTEARVPLLVLNACRSAHADVAGDPAEADKEIAAAEATSANPIPVDDAHARVRAYGSLAQEIVDAGVAGVVAMRYNVYVVTATKFIAEMYENLLAGLELGQAVTRGRKNLADDSVREIAFDRLSLQDWPVPVVYEVAPLQLFPRSPRSLTLEQREGVSNRPDGLPPAPDTGFYGRDETLLAIDRALDGSPIVLLYAFAGSGKTTTAAEFAHWYRLTGGLDDPDLGAGPVVFSSFELHKPLSAVLNDVWDAFGDRLPPDAAGRWMGQSVPGRRRLVFDLLRQLPVLWIWDNVEPISGFPAGSESAWTRAEMAELVDFLRDLRSTRAKVVLTSRRPEYELLGELPTRIALPPLAMLDRLQLARAIAERSGHRLADVADWRPLLRFTEGNPLTVTVLVREALRSGIRTRADVERFVDLVRSGGGDLEDDEDLGRSRSLGASLSYGLAKAFTEQERTILALLHLFQRNVSLSALQHVLELLRSVGRTRVRSMATRVTDDDVGRVLRRAAEIGLVSVLSEEYFGVHPALPWYFQGLFAQTFGPEDGPEGEEVIAAYVYTMSAIGNLYRQAHSEGGNIEPFAALDEANFLYARDLAIRHRWWASVMGPMRGVQLFYDFAGRDLELGRLIEEVVPLFVEQSSGLPPAELELDFLILTEMRIRVARRARNWDLAEQLVRSSLQVSERRAAEARATPQPDHDRLRSLGTDYGQLGLLLLEQQKPEAVTYLEKAQAVFDEAGEPGMNARVAGNLANAYLKIPELRDLDLAEQWLVRAIELYGEDRMGRGRCLGQLAQVKQAQLEQMLATGADQDAIKQVWIAAATRVEESFQILPSQAIRELALVHEVAGILFDRLVGQADRALYHYQQMIRMQEELGQPYQAAHARLKAALTLAQAGRFDDAVMFAEQAIQDFGRTGDLKEAERARQLLAVIKDRLE